MSEDDVLFGYRLQLVDLAGRVGVTAACRTFGVHRSTYYAWRRKIEREGLGALRPRERRRPRMPNQLSPLVEQRIVAFALGHPGLGPRRVAEPDSTRAHTQRVLTNPHHHRFLIGRKGRSPRGFRSRERDRLTNR